MLFTDRALIDGPARLTRDGYLVAEARVAKANNIQTYSAGELGLTDREPSSAVRVFRPEGEVFHKDALASAAHRPITLDHPKQDVTSENWKALSVGDIGGDVIRDGEFVRVPFKVMDSQAIKAARTTHQEFSLGYSADLDLTPGKFGDAEYDASMRNIRVNHLALCDTARGGPELRIVDERPQHLRDQEQRPMKIKIGDAEVDLTDGAAVALAVGTLNQKLTDATAQVGALTTDLAAINTSVVAKDAEIVTLKDQLEKAKVTPQQMRDAAKAYAVTVAKAKAAGVTVTDAMSEVEIQKAVVNKAMGDAAKNYTDGDFATAFAVLTKDAKIEATDALRDAITNLPVALGDARTEYAAAQEKRKRALGDAWKNPFNAADAAAH
jgi:hypothetical protein